MTNVVSVKQQMTHIIQAQPDDSSFEEILKELAFALMVDRGMEDSRAGQAAIRGECRGLGAGCGLTSTNATCNALLKRLAGSGIPHAGSGNCFIEMS